MEPIIRSAFISENARQLKRPGIQVREASLSTSVFDEEKSTLLPSPIEGQAPMPMTQAFVSAHMAISDEIAEQAQRREQDFLELKERVEKEAYAVGLKKGEQAAQKEMNERLAQLTDLAAQLGEVKKAVYEKAEDDIVAFIYEACCRIVADKVLNAKTLAEMVRQHSLAFKERGDLTIRLHPQDLDSIQTAVISKEFPDDIRWQGDTSIKLGGVMIENTSGALDARLETQFERLRDTLLTARQNLKSGGYA